MDRALLTVPRRCIKLTSTSPFGIPHSPPRPRWPAAPEGSLPLRGHMATQRLIIDGNARGQILLRVDGETVTIGDGDGARVLGPLRVERIRCVLAIDSAGAPAEGDRR